MASKAAIFCSGIAATFAIIAIGFAGGVMVAQSALNSPPTQVRVRSEPDPSLRVAVAQPSTPVVAVTTPAEILPPEPVQASIKDSSKDDQTRFQALRAEVQKRIEDRAKREQKRSAERKAKIIARARAIQQQQQQRALAYAPAEQALVASQHSLFNVSSSGWSGDARN